MALLLRTVRQNRWYKQVAEPYLAEDDVPAERRKATFQEPHFTPRELAQGWGLSDDTIRRWFEDETGVLKGGVDGNRGRRRKVFLRIPVSVAQRVYRERTK